VRTQITHISNQIYKFTLWYIKYVLWYHINSHGKYNFHVSSDNQVNCVKLSILL